MTEPRTHPGFAFVCADRPELGRCLADHLANHSAAGRAGRVSELDRSAWLVLWGSPAAPRRSRIRIRPGEAADVGPPVMGEDAAATSAVETALPPFAEVTWSPRARELTAQVDWLGFCHVYQTQGWHWAALSSSAAALGSLRGLGLDDAAIRVQAMLGWQLGSRSLHAGVRKLAPGERLVISAGSWRTEAPSREPSSPPPSSSPPSAGTTPAPAAASDPSAAQRAAVRVRELVGGFLDEHPDALLQLTGGLDSRILLAAIPPERRPQVEALTLVVPGSEDARIAARLAREHGMRHRLIDLDGLDDLNPGEAYARCVEAAARVESSADPLGLAALQWAERDLPSRPRLAGLGGEVARGFYYVGPPVPMPVTRGLAGALVRWRLAANERVETEAVHPEFLRGAERQVVLDVHAALASSGRHWWAATDELYLWQRMQRWAGVLASATCAERITLNPMLDRAFLDLVRTVPCSEKRTMLLLSRILLELDPDLARTEMDGRPAPEVYAERSWRSSARLTATQGRRVVGKVRQRRQGTTRPPAGGEVLGVKVTEHWRARPTLLDPVRSLGVFRDSWLDQVLTGRRSPQASTVALLLNLAVALERREDQAGTSRSRQPSLSGLVEGRTSARTEARDS